jgi:hypothetical protein
MPEAKPVDPAIMLVIDELRRGQDARDRSDATRHAEVLAAIKEMVVEQRALRAMAPGKGNLYLATSLVVLALVSILGLMSTRGVRLGEVAAATEQVMPTAP